MGHQQLLCNWPTRTASLLIETLDSKATCKAAADRNWRIFHIVFPTASLATLPCPDRLRNHTNRRILIAASSRSDPSIPSPQPAQAATRSSHHHVAPSSVRSPIPPSPKITPKYPVSLLTRLSHPAVISSCAENNRASPSAASATNAMANAPSATRTCVPRPSCASATSAASETTRTSASSVVAKASQTLSTALSVRGWRRIAMGVPRLSIWAVRGQM